MPGLVQTDRFCQLCHNDSKFIIFSVMYFVLHSMNYKDYKLGVNTYLCGPQ